jgi:NAD(P)-dependent dehydrogenase (short-subunit alcohol dehydrogenase family)
LKRELEWVNALVTGSSHGIGREVALALAAEGARVVVNGSPDRDGNSPAAEAVVGEIAARGGEAVACAASVADFAEAGALVECCVAEFGSIDVLVNCAGVPEPYGATILDLSEQDWRAVLDVHLGGTFHCCRHAAPRMVAQGAGSIINTSSHSFLGVYAGVAYPAAKGGVNSLTFALATDLREQGVRVNAVCPGAKTRLSSGPAYERRIRDLHARGILSDAERDVSLDPPEPRFAAPIYAFLAGERARAITGRLFSASGGYLGVFAQGREMLLAYRDHRAAAPWAVDEIAAAVSERGLD